MKRVKIKQGTLDWEKLRESRVGSSEIFDIVRYYASDEELWNCGINAERLRAEKPYTTVWALYHKLLRDGVYRRETLPPEFAEYGHAAEPYGVYHLGRGRKGKVKPGRVYIGDRLIASPDVEGIAEELDLVPFDCGHGTPKIGQRFVCEQKTMMPHKAGRGVPFKYIVQAQYQLLQTQADFYILQIMVLNEDTPFLRGKLCQMSKPKRFEYFDKNMRVGYIYFQNNPHLARLIEECIKRFFGDVDARREPAPFIECDSQQNIIESIRLNAEYNDKLIADYDLSAYEKARTERDAADAKKQRELQRIVEFARQHNACRFKSRNGATASFSKNGRFLLRSAGVRS